MIHPLLLRRVALEVHRSELATLLRCSVECIAAWEKGLSQPTGLQERKWEKALNRYSSNPQHQYQRGTRLNGPSGSARLQRNKL